MTNIILNYSICKPLEYWVPHSLLRKEWDLKMQLLNHRQHIARLHRGSGLYVHLRHAASLRRF